MPALIGSRRALLYSPPVAPSGPTTVFEVTLSGSESGFGGYTVRDIIDAANLAAATGPYVKVTLGLSSLGDGSTVEAYIGQQAAAGDPYDTTQMVQLTGGDFGAGTYTKSGTGAATIASGFVQLNEAYDETKHYVIAAQFSAAAATTFKLSAAANRSYYRFGADADVEAPAGPDPTDNGAFTTIVAKIEIQATP